MDKFELKKNLWENGMQFCFNKLYSSLNPKSAYYNDVIHLNLRLKLVEEEFNIKNIVSREERNLELARLQIALLEYIDQLSHEDFVSSLDILNSGIQADERKFNHFWRSFFDRKTSVVIGTYYSERFRAWEASTMMGTGDALALGKMLGVLNRVGVKGIEVVPTYNFSGDRYQNNLILLGGPDANEVTRRVFERLSTKLKFGNPDKNEISLRDSKSGTGYFSKYDSRNQVVGDYGMAFKTKNPFNPEATVIIIAGCFGFGTCAAAEIFENDNLICQGDGYQVNSEFEALVYSDIINDWVQSPILIQYYPL